MRRTLFQRRIGMRSGDLNLNAFLTIPVLRSGGGSAGPDNWIFNAVISVVPQGLSARLARAGECQFRVQYPWGWSSWTDFAVATTDGSGNASITVASTAMRFPSNYRVTARHIDSGAEVAFDFNIDASYNVTPVPPFVGGTVINPGSIEPPTFSQELGNRFLAFPEVRSFPFTTGFGAKMHQERPGSGIAFPEVRQWPNTGPNPALPGVLIRVRQGDDGPGHRNVAV